MAQLRAADRALGLYRVACLGEQSALAAGSADLITVAQAFHWLDYRRFYLEVDRVLGRSGVLALIGYARLDADPEIGPVIGKFYGGTIGPCWTPERRLVEREYRDIPIPVEEVPAPAFAIEADLTMAELLGYVSTWSAVGRYRDQHGKDPLPPFRRELERVWGEPESRRRIVWPLFVRAGRWKRSEQ
jgi:hypothetical protein